MNIYAIRDRMIDYFMQPFPGPDDKNVLAAVATRVNQGEPTDAICQAPHHFEVWKLAEIHNDGHITPARELIADCASLVRASVRQDGTGPAHQGAHRGAGSYPGSRVDPGAKNRPVPDQVSTAAVPAPPSAEAAG